MRHGVFGKKLGRGIDEKNALFKSLIREFVDHGKIITTVTKAKAVKPLIDKLVTKVKKGNDLHARRELLKVLPSESVTRMVEVIVPRLESRTSGFSRLIHLNARIGDDAKLAILEWVEPMPQPEPVKKEKAPAKAKKTAKIVKSEKKEAVVKTKVIKEASKKSKEESKPAAKTKRKAKKA